MRIFPEMWPSTMWPFSSFTLNIALGRVSTISPCIWIVSSFAMRRLAHREARAALEVRLLEQALVLVRHQVGLELRHEIHRHHHGDEERGAAEIERHVVVAPQELRHQADERDVDRADEREGRDDPVHVLRRLLARADPRDEGAALLEVVRRLLRVEDERRVEEAEEDDRRG